MSQCGQVGVDGEPKSRPLAVYRVQLDDVDMK